MCLIASFHKVKAGTISDTFGKYQHKYGPATQKLADNEPELSPTCRVGTQPMFIEPSWKDVPYVY